MRKAQANAGSESAAGESASGVAMPQEPIPFTVIGGFLGAGKTTLVNHILANSDGVRYALLVNDFGRINIDEQLVASHDGQTMELSNGCICCSLADGFVKTMLLLMRQIDRFDHIVVETSGVAEPNKIMDFARIDPALYPEGIIVLADAAEIARRVSDPQIEAVVRAQITCASLLLLNKVDTVNEEQKQQAIELLTQLNNKAPLLQCRDARVPTDLLFGYDSGAAEGSEAKTETRVTGSGNLAGGPETVEPDSTIDASAVAEFPFASHSVTSTEPLDRGAFDHFRSQLPGNILRVKGLLRFAGEGGQYYLWQRSGMQEELTRWTGKSVMQSQLVFISSAAAEEFLPLTVMADKLFAPDNSSESNSDSNSANDSDSNSANDADKRLIER